MATGGNPDNPDVDLSKFWEDKDIEFMAAMLRGTGKFHVVPRYGEEHHLTYEEEREEEENIAASSLRAVHTPRSYDDHSKTYKVVRPPTPTPGISGPTQPQPPTLPPIVEDFPPLPPKPPATKDYKSHVQFEHLKQMGKVYGPIENKGMPTHSAATKMPSSLPTKTTGYPSEQGRTFRAQPVTVKQEEPTGPRTTFNPSHPLYPSHPSSQSQPINHPAPPATTHPSLHPLFISHQTTSCLPSQFDTCPTPSISQPGF